MSSGWDGHRSEGKKGQSHTQDLGKGELAGFCQVLEMAFSLVFAAAGRDGQFRGAKRLAEAETRGRETTRRRRLAQTIPINTLAANRQSTVSCQRRQGATVPIPLSGRAVGNASWRDASVLPRPENHSSGIPVWTEAVLLADKPFFVPSAGPVVCCLLSVVRCARACVASNKHKHNNFVHLVLLFQRWARRGFPRKGGDIEKWPSDGVAFTFRMCPARLFWACRVALSH